ncbi:MAG: DNA primase, partial [Oscillospiraceae bacterium]|nr:DNA primase [Oscillospiraceae bacterium]
MAFSDHFLNELAARCEISEVVSRYVPLTKKGNNLWALCPFHNEKTPSFSVSVDKQIYHCFGCGKGGGVINFIMEAEQLSFPDAVRFLADQVGMEIPDDQAEFSQKRARLLELNQAAARFFHQTLLAPEGQAAMEYIRRRGISRGAVTRFGLGAAPNRWDGLLTAMRAQGFDTQALLDVGLVLRNKNGHVYDRF